MDEINNKKITLWDCIKSFYKNYVNFKGKASKKEFWMTFFIMFIGFPLLLTILTLIISLIFKWHSQFMGLIPVFYLMISIIPMVSITFRRISDTGRNRLFGLLPLGIFLLTYLWPCFMDPWNPNSSIAAFTFMAVITLLDIIALIILCSPDSNSHIKKEPDSAIFVVNNTADELLKLKDLLDKGILTQEEFEEQKKKILNK